jgi:hypothetical protein
MSPTEWTAQCDGPYLSYDISNLIESGHARLVAKEIKSGLLLVQRSDKLNLEIPEGVSADIELGSQALPTLNR